EYPYPIFQASLQPEAPKSIAGLPSVLVAKLPSATTLAVLEPIKPSILKTSQVPLLQPEPSITVENEENLVANLELLPKNRFELLSKKIPSFTTGSKGICPQFDDVKKRFKPFMGASAGFVQPYRSFS